MGYKWGGPHGWSPLPLALRTEDRCGMKAPQTPGANFFNHHGGHLDNPPLLPSEQESLH